MRSTKALAVTLSIFAPCAWSGEAKPELALVRELTGTKGNKVLLYKHKAVTGMDSPGYVASGYEHCVSLGLPAGFDPRAGKSYPLLVWLHGFGDKGPGTGDEGDDARLRPMDYGVASRCQSKALSPSKGCQGSRRWGTVGRQVQVGRREGAHRGGSGEDGGRRAAPRRTLLSRGP